MLIEGALAKDLKKFITDANKMEQKDAEKAIDDYCKNAENAFYKAIRSIQIIIPTSAIQVQGSAAAQTNIAPIVLNNVVK